MMKKLIALVLALSLCLGCTAAFAEKYGIGTYVDPVTPTDASVVDGDAYDGSVTYNSTICALVLDDEGKIISALFDAVQSKGAITTEGKFSSVSSNSKLNLGDDYNMVKFSSAIAEWYEQSAALSAWCVGKTVEEVLNMPTYARDEQHTAVPDVEELKSSVTITVGSFLAALEIAAANAK